MYQPQSMVVYYPIKLFFGRLPLMSTINSLHEVTTALSDLERATYRVISYVNLRQIKNIKIVYPSLRVLAALFMALNNYCELHTKLARFLFSSPHCAWCIASPQTLSIDSLIENEVFQFCGYLTFLWRIDKYNLASMPRQ
jgi:hypothetical protein